MCAGLPVVVSDIDGDVSDLFKDGINGYTFTDGNINQLAEKLFLILSNEELHISMGN